MTKNPNYRKENLWKILHIPPSVNAEVAIICCDGCPRNKNIWKAADQINEKLRPHLSFISSIPPLLWNKDISSKLRVIKADAKISLACPEECPKILLSNTIDIDRSYIVPDDEEQINSFCNNIAREIDSILNIQTIEKDSPPLITPANQVVQRPFHSERKQPNSHQIKEKINTASTPNNVNIIQEIKPYNPQHFFTNSDQSKKRHPITSILFIAAIILGGTWLYNHIQSNNLNQKLTNQNQKKELKLKNNQKQSIHSKIKQKQLSNTSKQKEEQITPNNPKNQKIKKEKINTPQTEKQITTQKKKITTSTTEIKEKISQKNRKTSSEPKLPEFIPSDPFNLGWIGGECIQSVHCHNPGGFCFKYGESGVCSQPCLKFCPDKRKPGYTSSFCISSKVLKKYVPNWPESKFGYCLPRCDVKLYPNRGCRINQRCVKLPLIRDPNIKMWICIPKVK